MDRQQIVADSSSAPDDVRFLPLLMEAGAMVSAAQHLGLSSSWLGLFLSMTPRVRGEMVTQTKAKGERKGGGAVGGCGRRAAT